MWKDLKVPFLTIIFALLSLFIFTKIFGPIPFSVQSVVTNKNSLFTTSGTSEATAVPDTAMTTIGVSTTAPSVEAAQKETNTKINRITTELKSLGIEEKNIKTSDYSIRPDYGFENGKETPLGYIVSININVESDSVEKINQAIDTAVQNGANQISNVQFVLNEEKQKELEQKATKDAIDIAKQKAEEIAKTTGIKIGRIIDVQLSSNVGGPIPLARNIELDAVEKTETELEPGENKVSITATLSFETY